MTPSPGPRRHGPEPRTSRSGGKADLMGNTEGKSTSTAPPVVAESGWEPVRPLRIEGGRGSFVTGDPEGDTLRVAYFQRKSERPLVGRAWFGTGSQGPPGHAHGGSMAAVVSNLAKLPEADRAAIAAYLKAIPGIADPAPEG